MPLVQPGKGLARLPRGARVLDLHGLDPATARRVVAKGLDSAYVDGVTELRIVHGNGHGVLKGVTMELIHQCPLVSRVRDAHTLEGGAGVAIVEFGQELPVTMKGVLRHERH